MTRFYFLKQEVESGMSVAVKAGVCTDYEELLYMKLQAINRRSSLRQDFLQATM